MRAITVLLLAAIAAFGADWDRVRHVEHGRKIEVISKDGKRVKGMFDSATDEGVVVREEAGEQSVMRSDIKRVRVYDPARRIRKGVMWTIIGAGLGAGAGVATCPYCGNEGNPSPYIGPGAAGGAAIGALGFLSDPYSTIYKQ